MKNKHERMKEHRLLQMKKARIFMLKSGTESTTELLWQATMLS